MFLNKGMFDLEDESAAHSSEELLPNEVNTTSSVPNSPTKQAPNSPNKSRMKDMLKEQRALAAKKQQEKKRTNMNQMVRSGDSIPSSPSAQSRIRKSAFDSDSDGDGKDFGYGREREAWNKESVGDSFTSAEQDISDMGIAPIFDPTIIDEPVPTLDLSNMTQFLTTPPPDGVRVQCFIIRNKDGLKNKLYPKYELYMKDGDRFLMAAKKRGKNKTSNYIVSIDKHDLNKGSPNYMGKLRANFIGTEFILYSDGNNPNLIKSESAAVSQSNIRKELGAVFYQSNILGSRGPRKMTVLMPKVSRKGSPKVWQPLTEDESVAAAFKRGDTHGMLCLENKSPKWNEQVGAYVLNFNGRVTMASVKNFQLIAPEDPENVIMQFGRVARDKFTMDFSWPMTPLQSFMIALSSFDYKIACE